MCLPSIAWRHLGLVALLAGVSACAGQVSGPSEFDRLTAACRARGGLLEPLPGPMRPNEASNYGCVIRGGDQTRPAAPNF